MEAIARYIGYNPPLTVTTRGFIYEEPLLTKLSKAMKKQTEGGVRAPLLSRIGSVTSILFQSICKYYKDSSIDYALRFWSFCVCKLLKATFAGIYAMSHLAYRIVQWLAYTSIFLLGFPWFIIGALFSPTKK